jgi:hypothetical protein
MKPLHHSYVPTAVAALLLTAGAARAADTSGSQRVGDLQYGNELDPGGFGAALLERDRLGWSLLRAGASRTPTGQLYTSPTALPEDQDIGDWHYTSGLEAGYTTLFGDDDAQFFRQYAGWSDGLAISLAWLDLWQPNTGDYIEGRLSWLGDSDNYFRLRGGRYGDYRVEAFYRSIPHVVSTTAFPIWQGIGTDTLTLPASLVPGNSSAIAVQTVSDAAARRTVRVDRTRAGLSIEGDIGRDWIGYGALTNEQRKGTRLWGGPFFFNFPFLDNGGVLETLRPIDFSTTDLSAGVRRAGSLWRFNAVYSGSFFRNSKRVLDYQNPFLITPVTGTPAAGILSQGQFSLEPNNDAHNLRMELARTLPQRGELSLTAAIGTMRQNDALIAPISCQGLVGIDLSPGPNYTIDCANWNTPASLSRLTADARIDTLLLNAKISFHPTDTFDWHAGLRRYREDNKTRYQSYNPLTGEYGYISENGSQGTVVPGEMGIFDANNPLYLSYIVQIANLPTSYTDSTAELAGDWRLGYRNALNLTYTFRLYEPDFRERKRTNEHRLQIALTSRGFAGGTLRTSYEVAKRDGDRYDYFPYEPFYSESLPGYVATVGALPFTVDAMRKYDLSNRDQQKFRAIYTRPIGENATLSGTLYGQYNHYDTLIGRKGDNGTGFTLQWDYQPMPRLTVNASAGMELSKLRLTNVADAEAVVSSDPALGGAKFPLANLWNQSDRERSLNATLQFTYQWARTRLEGGYNFVDSRGRLRYDYASIGAIAVTQQPFAATAGQFPDTHYQMHSLDLSLTQMLSKQWSARVFGRYQHGRFTDWHYSGFDNTLAYDHRVYTDRGPAAKYDTGLIGLMFRYVP